MLALKQVPCADAGAALQMEEVNTARPKIMAADKALTDLHTEPQCTRLVESIVTKYLALTPAELEEWQVRAAASLARYAGHRATGAILVLCIMD